jgi:hypothetical protein
LARIERCKERTKRFELAYNAGWRPLGDLKWSHPAVIAWCSLFGGMREYFLDNWEHILGCFEELLPARPALPLGPRLLGRKRKR